MATRRQAREWALQLLFQLDVNPSPNGTPLDAVIENFWNQQWGLHAHAVKEETGEAPPPPCSAEAAASTIAPRNIRGFVERLVRGVVEHRPAIDTVIMKYANNWSLSRMGNVDRNVLRLALFEIYHSNHAPPVVVINEAVDLAKYFSNSDSGRFVNGLLDRAVRENPPRQ